jgi:phage FluMu protein Com
MPARLNWDIIEEKGNLKHNNKYKYPKQDGPYKGVMSFMKIICPIHDVFYQRIQDHLSGCGCPDCGGFKKSNKENFVVKANKIHPLGIFSYEHFIYINSKTQSWITCNLCNKDFLQSSNNHLKGNGCPYCDDSSKRYTKEEFIIEVNKIHIPGKFGYDNFIYTKIEAKSWITCFIHNKDFLQSAKNHLKGSGCPDCAIDSRKYSKEEIIIEFNKIHPIGKYSYNNFIYINSKTPGWITCLTHNKDFLQVPQDHLKGHGCPSCSHTNSKKEQAWIKWLNDDQILSSQTIRINNKWYKPDGLNIQEKKVYEFKGNRWHGNPAIYNQNAFFSKRQNITYGDLNNKTIQREEELKAAGYTIISIWESEWDEIVKAEKNNFNLFKAIL